MTRTVTARVIPILDVDTLPIGVWSRDPNQSFTEAWAELMGSQDPALSKLRCTRTMNEGITRLGPTVAIQDGAFLMLEDARAPVDDLRNGYSYVAATHFGVLSLKRVDVPFSPTGTKWWRFWK